MKSKTISKLLALMVACLLCLSATSALAEWPAIASFTGPGDQLINDALALSDGGFLLAGSNSAEVGEAVVGNTWGWLICLDAQGNTVWEYKHERGHQKNRFERVQGLEDGSFLGLFLYFGDETYYEIVHVSADGALLSHKELPTAYGYNSAGEGFFLLRNREEGRFFEQVNAEGEVIATLDLSQLSDFGGMVTPLEDGHLLHGYGTSTADYDARTMVARIDGGGNVLWTDYSRVDSDGYLSCAVALPGGDMLLAGNRWKEGVGNGNLMNGLAARYTLDGEKVWFRDYPHDGFGVSWTAATAYEGGALLMGEMFYDKLGIIFSQMDADGNIVDEWWYETDKDEFFAMPAKLLTTDNGSFGVVLVSNELSHPDGGGFDAYLIRADKPE